MPESSVQQTIPSSNPKRWRKPLQATEASSDDIDAYILWKISVYKEKNWRDDYLWEYFQEDFETFTKDTFALADTTSIRELRDILRAKGVYVKRARGKPIAKALADVLQQEVQPEWPEDEFDKQLNAPDGFNSRLNPFLNSTIPQIPNTTVLPPSTSTAA